MKCSTCTKSRAPRRRYCYSCIQRKYETNNPLRYSYNVNRQNAKRRNKIWELTFEEFCKFCYRTEYIQKKGTSKTSYHIDRIEEEKGYTKDNIQILQNGDNVRKYLVWKSRDELGNHFEVKREDNITDSSHDDCPF